MTTLRAGWFRVRFTAWTRDYSYTKGPHWLWGPFNGYRAAFPRSKVPGTWG